MISRKKLSNTSKRTDLSGISYKQSFQGQMSSSPLLDLPIVPTLAATNSTSSEQSTVATYEPIDIELASIVKDREAKRGSIGYFDASEKFNKISYSGNTHRYHPRTNGLPPPRWQPISTSHYPRGISYGVYPQQLDSYNTRNSYKNGYNPNNHEHFSSYPNYHSRAHPQTYCFDENYDTWYHYQYPPPLFHPLHPLESETYRLTPQEYDQTGYNRGSVSSETPSLAESYSSLELPETRSLHQMKSDAFTNNFVPYSTSYSGNILKTTKNRNSSQSDGESTSRSQTSIRFSDHQQNLGNSPLLLALAEDKLILSEALCIVRSNVEVFAASMDDINAPAPGRKNAVTLGQIGLRCIHCIGCKMRVKRAQCYPSSISR